MERLHLRPAQKATGLTPTEYVQHLRVGKARESLEFSSLAMKEIARKVGYEDDGSFRRVFQKVMGLTIASDSAFKEIEIIANCKFSERQTPYCSEPEIGSWGIAPALSAAEHNRG